MSQSAANKASRPAHPQRLSLVLLIIGASCGLIFGWASSTNESETVLSVDVVALVNQVAISRADYQRALHLLAKDKRSTLSDADRNLVLQRLIEEELLIQEAIRTGLLRNHAQVRSAMISSLIAGLDSNSEPRLPTAPLAYQDNQLSFTLQNYLETLRLDAPIQWRKDQ